VERNIDVSFANLDDQEMVEPLIDEANMNFVLNLLSAMNHELFCYELE